MGVDYSTVSQGRKRLREKRKRDVPLNNPDASNGEVLLGPADNRALTPHKAPGASASVVQPSRRNIPLPQQKTPRDL